MKQIFTFLFLASLLLVGGKESLAQTTVSPLILSDQVWDISGSPYLITQNTYIDTGVKVTIMPGVEVLTHAANLMLQVDGELQALGTSDSTIYFDSLQIRLNEASVSYDSSTGAGAYFNNCVFTSPGIGKMVIYSRYIGVRIENCLFVNAYYGVYAMATSMTSPRIEIMNCTFNDSTGTSYPVYTSSTNIDVHISGCTFNNYGKGGGMHISAAELNMTDNTLNGQNRLTVSALSANINCNTFKNMRSGVELRMYAKDSVDSYVFTHNTLDSNGSTFSGDAMLTIYKLFNMNSSRFNNNNFLTNAGTNEKVKISGYNPTPSSSETIDLTDNYWVSTDSATIESYIMDYADNINIFGRADISGFLSTEDTSCTDNTSSCNASFYVAVDTVNIYNLFVINNSTGTGSTTNYYWTFGDGSGSNAQNPTHTYSGFGAYQLCLTISDSANNCYSTYCDSIGLDSNGNLLKNSAFTITVLNEGDVLSIEEREFFSNTQVYPNPSSGTITIEMPVTGFRNIQFNVMDLTGRTVQNGQLIATGNNANTINLSGLQNGMYLLQLQYGDEKFTTRVMLNR